MGKKSSEKSSKNVFCIHTNIVTKNGGEKRAKQFFRNTRIVLSKMLGKNRRKKVRKTFFYIHTNIVTKKWGEQNEQNNFSRYTRIVRAKNVGKKIVGKKCEKVFLYSQEYSDQKMGGTKRAKQFFQKHTNSGSKKCWGKNRRKKVRKTFFYIHTNIVIKK